MLGAFSDGIHPEPDEHGACVDMADDTTVAPPGASTDPATDTTAGPGAGPGAGLPPAEKDQEAQRQRDREIFRRLQAEAGGEPEAESGTNDRVPARILAPTNVPAPPPSNPQGTLTSAKPATEAKSTDDAGKRELELIAETILRRDGLTDSARKLIISQSTPEELREMVDRRAKVQRDTDKIGNELAEARRRLQGVEKQPADDLADLTPKQRALVEKVKAEGDDDRAEELVDTFREGRSTTTPSAENATQRTTGNQRPSDGLSPEERAVIHENRLVEGLRPQIDELAKRFPSLKDEQERRELTRLADRLVAAGVEFQHGGERATVMDVLNAAASVRYRKESSTAAQRAMLESNRRERSGQPDPKESLNAPKTPMSEQQRGREAYRHLAAGKTPEEIRRLLGEDTTG